MARAAFIIGGTGQIGRAAAAGLLRRGWRVTLAHTGRHADDWQTAFPVFKSYPSAPFDYVAEDAAA